MISFDLGEELDLIRQSASRFAQEQLRGAARSAERARQVPQALCQAFAELGLGSVTLAENLGGLGLGAVAAVCVAESLAEGDPALALALPQAGAFAALLQALGTAEQQRTWLQAFAEQPHGTWGAVAFTERGGPAVGVATKAMRQGSGFLLQGQKDFVLHAALADRVVVLAQLEGEGDSGLAAFVMHTADAGLKWGELERTVGLEAVRVGSLQLDNVRVDGTQRLGSGHILPALDAFFARQSLHAAALSVGTAQAAYAYALKYAQDRQAFGKPVAHFQSIAFLLSDMLMQTDAARWLTRYAAWACDQGREDALLLMQQARALADEAVSFVTDNAVQILGGHGYIQDHPVEKWMRDAKALALLHGSRESADCRSAAALLGEPAAPTLDLLPLGSLQPIWT